MHLRGLLLFTWLLPGAARRSIRLDLALTDAQQQNNTLSEELDVSAETREVLLPGGIRTTPFRRGGPQTRSLHLSAENLEAHLAGQPLRAGPRRATVALHATSSPGEDQMPLNRKTHLAPLHAIHHTLGGQGRFRHDNPVMTTAQSPQEIKLYTNTACPFAQRVWIALEATGLSFEKVDVNLYGSGGFDKSKLKEVEARGGLSPKGYIPVVEIGDEVIRESSVCVERVAALSAEAEGATSLMPEQPIVARELIDMCNSLPKSERSRQLDALLKRADAALEQSSAYLAGNTFSIADACLLPFLQRVEYDIPSDAKHLRAYMARMHKFPAFSKTVTPSWWWWW